MTQEDRELLLKDLSARLPYSVIVHVEGSIGGNYLCGDSKLIGVHNGIIHVENAPAYGNYVGLPLIIDIKPYLRPMSSMTEEEKKEIENLAGSIIIYNEKEGGSTLFDEVGLDWLNTHYFDYRGLIEKGLALEAPDDMY